MELRLPPNKCVIGAKTGIGCSNREHYAMEMRISQHPKSMRQRDGRKVKDEYGRTIGHTGEMCRKLRHTNASTRSKLAKSSASGHAQIFVLTQRDTDRAIDYSARPIGTHTTRQWTTKSVRRSQLRSSL